ncbi:alpha-2-macroglobulin [Azospirillum sp. SYSU D00513]|uniref:alpha-2-macroglobulin family protein n=1 Tax=Azospirillum sp. SYSU D00513 TaxID=2812561 RepID=UPI001A96473C|nr:alpha-2-macroglobulin [Azospirillum sp. SYSU D00513]
MQRAFGRVLAVLVASASLPATAQEGAPPEPSPFGVSSVEVAAERDQPQACFAFTGRLDASPGVNYRDHVAVEPADAGAAVARGNSLCVEGLQHGRTYRITLREGLPGADGARLGAPDSREIAVPNRKAALAFRGAGYILPRVGAAGLPLRSINLDRAKLQVLRIADRSLVEKIYFGRVSQQLSDYDVGGLVDQAGQEVWRGEMAIANAVNQAVVTPFPIDALLGKLDPGVYIAVASAEEIAPGGWDRKATQWFVVSDLGLNTIMGEDGLVVFARSLGTAQPEPGVELRLLARDNSELGRVTTGLDGLARIDLPAAPPPGKEPQALFAYRGAGDFGFLDLAGPQASATASAGPAPGTNAPGASAPASNTGAAVPAPRAAAGLPEAFLYTERGIYRPGEAAELALLLRDGDANPVTGRTLTVKILRPDGFEVERRTLGDAGGGGYATRIGLGASAYPGAWSVTAHLEADGPAVGRVEFLVEDFVPPRLDVALSAETGALPAEGSAVLTLESHYLYGAPAAGLPGEAVMTLRAAANPYPNHSGFRFGLAQEEVRPVRTELPGFTTGPMGRARLEVRLAEPPKSSRPLEAVVRGTLLDVGGRPVSRELVLPVRHQPFAIGIRPRFEGDGVPEGATAGFDVIAVGPDGAALDKQDLSYELFEEEHEYVWVEADGRWDYTVKIHDRRVTGGGLAIEAAKPASVETPVSAGRYRLEVFDAKTGVATSLRFAAGWWMTPTAAERPDEVDVSIMLPSHKGGDTAWVFVKPPYESQVLIAVADRKIRQATTRAIGPEGAFLQIPVDPTWTGGVYVLATAFATPASDAKAAPRRAVGLSWLAVDSAERRLGVEIAAPREAGSRNRVEAEVVVAGIPEGQPAYVTVAAVDEAVLQLTDRPGSDPAGRFLGKRRLGVELRDAYGRLVEPVADADRPRPGQTAPRLRQAGAALPRKSERVVALFSGIRTVGPDGRLSVPLAIPDFQGRLRLTAVAWSGGKLGYAESHLQVRDPLLADAALPRFLAAGDRAEALVTLDNPAGPAGRYTLSLTAGGALSFAEEGAAGEVPADLGRGERASVRRVLKAEGAGTGVLSLEVSGPDGTALTRRWEIPVRAAGPDAVRRSDAPLPAGAEVSLPAGLTAGLLPGTLSATLSLGGPAGLDVPDLLFSLDRSAGGGLERSASRALPLLPFGGAAVSLGLLPEKGLKPRLQQAVDRVLSYQRADGAFAAWSPRGEADPWLTAYALDFLGRAEAAGLGVPALPYRKGLDWLKQTLDNSWVETDALPGRAYALYVLARVGMVGAETAQFFRENHWDKLPTDLARAQLAAALARLGDGAAASEAFGRLSGARVVSAALRDYGSSLRDEAGVLALMAESGAVEADRLRAAAERLAKTVAGARATSVQEQAWLARAAEGLLGHSEAVRGPMTLSIGGQKAESARPIFRRLDPLAPKPLEPAVANAGSEPLPQTVTVMGALDTAAGPSAEPSEQGMTIRRGVFDMSGRPSDPSAAGQNDLLVVILEGEATDQGSHQALVTDRLPAGLEIEAVRLAESAPLGELSWLGALSPVRHVEQRDDRFMAVVELGGEARRFRLAYLARAVTPGDFAMPGASVESLYRPNQAARTSDSRLRVLPD